jgi:hypothetical protein
MLKLSEIRGEVVIFVDGQIPVEESRPVHRIAAGIAEEIPAVDCAARRWSRCPCEIRTLCREGSRRSCGSKAAEIQVLQRASVICRYGIASRNAVRKVKRIRAVLAKWIA